MSRFLVRAVVLISAAGLLLLPHSSDAEQVDQQYDAPPGLAYSGSDAVEVGQTFTVGIEGTLTRAEVKIFKFPFFSYSGDAVLTLYNTSGGFPSTPLGSVNVNHLAIPFNTPAFISFDFSSLSVPVGIGDMLAVGLRSSGTDTYPWAVDSTSTYSGGKAVWRVLGVPPGSWQIQTGENFDFAFKTYVEAAGPSIDPDLNEDGFVDSKDIDILWNVIRPELAGDDDPGADDDEDLNGDGFVNEDDVDYMLANLLTAGANRAYGDADLDGGVGGLDFTAWRVRAGTGWANGDFDGDGGIGGLDFTLWRTRPTEYPGTVGPHAGGLAAVPEPSTVLLALLGIVPVALACCCRRSFESGTSPR